MKFAAGLTVTGILGLLLMEALKIIMVPVSAWLLSVLVVVVKIVLILVAILIAAGVIGVGVWIYRRGKKASAEA